jgi:hypothetical protein
MKPRSKSIVCEPRQPDLPCFLPLRAEAAHAVDWLHRPNILTAGGWGSDLGAALFQTELCSSHCRIQL